VWARSGFQVFFNINGDIALKDP